MVVVLQSKDVLTQPRCLLELYTAAVAGIPIVSLVCSGKGYDFASSQDHLLHLDTTLVASNPAAVRVLEANDAPVLRVAQVLWARFANVIRVPLNSMGSKNAILVAVAELVKAVQRAVAIPATTDEAVSWLEDRETRDEAALVEAISNLHGVAQRGRVLHRLGRVDALVRKVAELEAAGQAEAASRDARVAELELQNERLLERLAGVKA